MSRIKYICTLALALCCATAVFAQNAPQTQNAQTASPVAAGTGQNEPNLEQLDRELQKAVERQQILQAKINEYKPRCVFCGEIIRDPSQHCSAKEYTGLCSTYVPEPEPVHSDNHPGYWCSKCREMLSTDEIYHGVPHHCKCEYCEEPILTKEQPCYAQDEGHICTPQEYCIYCGRPITVEHQTCEHGGMCTTHCPECGRDLRDPENLDNKGVHHCRGKLHITPVKPKK